MKGGVGGGAFSLDVFMSGRDALASGAAGDVPIDFMRRNDLLGSCFAGKDAQAGMPLALSPRVMNQNTSPGVTASSLPSTSVGTLPVPHRAGAMAPTGHAAHTAFFPASRGTLPGLRTKTFRQNAPKPARIVELFNYVRCEQRLQAAESPQRGRMISANEHTNTFWQRRDVMRSRLSSLIAETRHHTAASTVFRSLRFRESAITGAISYVCKTGKSIKPSAFAVPRGLLSKYIPISLVSSSVVKIAQTKALGLSRLLR